MNNEINDLIRIISTEDKSKEATEERLVCLPGQTPNELSIEYLRAQIDRQKEDIEGLKQDRQQRKYLDMCYIRIYVPLYDCGVGHCLLLRFWHGSAIRQRYHNARHHFIGECYRHIQLCGQISFSY